MNATVSHPLVSPKTTITWMAPNGVVALKMSHVCLDVAIVIQMTNVMVLLFAVVIIAKMNFHFPEPSGTRKQIAVLVCMNTRNEEGREY